MVGGRRRVYFTNIPDRYLSKVCRVGLLRVFVPVGRENAPASGVLKAEAHAANPTEKIDEAEVMPHFSWLVAPKHCPLQACGVLVTNGRGNSAESSVGAVVPRRLLQFVTAMISESTAFLPNTPSSRKDAAVVVLIALHPSSRNASASEQLESAVLDPGLPIRYDRPINVSSLKIGNSAIISCGQDA
jgi:hypothetical protein